jgi:hypothetical protein
MRSKLVSAAAGAALAILLLGASSASAATEVGNSCVGDRANQEDAPSATIVQLSSTTNPGSVSVSVAGVITKWKVNVVPYPGGISEKLKVLRSTGGNSFTTVGESTTQAIVGGQNTFDTRIPVQPGDRLGAYSSLAAIYCESSSSPGDVLGVAPDTPLGATASYKELPNGQVAISAIVEPDTDNDGFGDETQDLCPQNAAVQTACPVPVTFATFKQVKKGSITMVVTPSATSTVSVKGIASLGKGKKAKLNAGSQLLSPGLQGKFKLFFNKKLKAKLRELSPKQSLTLKVTISGTNVVGPPTKKTLKVKLKGQAKP